MIEKIERVKLVCFINNFLKRLQSLFLYFIVSGDVLIVYFCGELIKLLLFLSVIIIRGMGIGKVSPGGHSPIKLTVF